MFGADTTLKNNSDVDIYLPPDTPISRPSPKIIYQMNKNQELKKHRAIERLRAYHFEQLADRRKIFSSCVVREQLPRQHFGSLDAVSSPDHLKEILPDLLKLLDDIEKLKAGEITVETLCPPYVPDLDMRTKLLMNEKVRETYADRLDVSTYTLLYPS